MRHSLSIALAVVLLCPAAHAQPVPHHPGRWSVPRYFGRDAAHASVAVNLLLLRGEPGSHSLVLGYGWDGSPTDSLVSGALWGWNPASDDCDASVQANFTLLPLGSPPYNPHASGASVMPDGDVLVVGGDEGHDVGVRSCAIFHRATHAFTLADATQQRHFNATSTVLADGRVLASSGFTFRPYMSFGGRADGAPPDARLRMLELTAQGAWSPAADPSGTWPSAREGHSLSILEDGPAVMFGGRGVNSTMLADTWQVAPAGADFSQDHAWTRLTTAVSPPARMRHAACVIAGASRYQPPMVMFGGEDGAGTPLGDLWRLTFDYAHGTWTWTSLPADSVVGTPPVAQSGIAAGYAPAAVIVLLVGGRDAGGALSDAVWVLASPGGRPVWKRPLLLSSQHPGGRWQHALAMDPYARTRGDARSWVRGFVFGGAGAAGLNGDLWTLWVTLSGDTAEWVPMSTAGPSPRARSGSSFVYDDVQARLVLLGGDTGGVPDPVAWSLIPDVGRLTWSALAAAGSSLTGQAAWLDPNFQAAIFPEIFDPASGQWTLMPAPHVQRSYPFMFVHGARQVFEAGPTTTQYKTWSLDPVAGTWQQLPADTTRLDGSTAVMYRPGKVMKSGNGAVYVTASAEARWIDLDEPSPRWRRTANAMASGRSTHMLTVLADGQVLASGGTLTRSNSTPVRRPELWDPDWIGAGGARGWWYGGIAPDTLAADTMVRGYHSTAVLLPDGRVLSAGGIFDPAHDVKMNLYCPPYLYNADGSAATRPRIDSAPASVAWGATFTVVSPDSIARAALIRPASATHGITQDQCYVPLVRAGGALPSPRFVAPADGGIAPPGDYLLFVLNPAGTPSIGRWITMGGTGSTGVPTQSPVVELEPPAPNPSGSLTTFRFGLGARGQVELDVMDVQGRRVRRLVSGALPAGRHAFVWDGRDGRGARVPAGKYFAELRSAGIAARSSIVRLR